MSLLVTLQTCQVDRMMSVHRGRAGAVIIAADAFFSGQGPTKLQQAAPQWCIKL
jgi:hypothetical protein